METTYPYRVAWHKPKSVHVRPQSRAAVLDALEYEFPTSRQRLLAATELGAVTLRHACRQLTRERVTALKYGQDPDTHHACDLITWARYPVLPVLELSDAYMIWRLCDTLGESVFATVRDRGGFRTAEDDLAILMGQVSTVLNAGTCGLSTVVPMQPPVLLKPSPMNSDFSATTSDLPRDADALLTLVRRVLDHTPAFILTPEEATAHELRYLPALRQASCVLHIRLGVSDTATLLSRQIANDVTSPWIPAPYATGLSEALRQSIQGAARHSAIQWSRVAEFVSAFGRFLSPDCIVLETDDPRPQPDRIQAVLPSRTSFFCMSYALNTPSLAHRGALRLSRRVLWDSMMESLPSLDRHPPER